MNMDSAKTDSLYADLMSHIVAELGPLLPAGKTLVASNFQLLLASTDGGKSRTESTYSVAIPGKFDVANAELFSRRLLSDAQDLVSLHLHEP